MAKTPFKEWTYPDEFEDPFFDKFEAAMGSIDSSVHQNEVLTKTIIGGGGSISWTSGGGVGWSEDFVVPIFESGFKVLVRFGPDEIARNAQLDDGEILYAEIAQAISENIVVNMAQASTLPKGGRYFPLMWRDGDTLRLRDGRTFTF